MNWAHLPVQGGIYDQHPDLIDQFEEIFSIQSRIEAKKADQEKAKASSRKRSK
jgi:hypothetical protein